MRKAQIGDPKTAVAYVRVSTEEQQNGPEAQRAQIAAWAAREGVAVVETFEDRVSGAKPVEQRPGLMLAIEALRTRRAGVLIVAKRDRIARDVVIAMTVERIAKARGAELVSADGVARGDDPANQFMRVVVDGAAAYERGLIRARTKAAMAAKAARGEYVGNTPYGWRLAHDGVHLELHPDEQKALVRVRALAAEGLSWRSIGRQLALEGHLNRAGKRFDVTAIGRILGRTSAPTLPTRILSCARGHVHDDPARAGSFCLRDACSAGRGDQDPDRRIEWRTTAPASRAS